MKTRDFINKQRRKKKRENGAAEIYGGTGDMRGGHGNTAKAGANPGFDDSGNQWSFGGWGEGKMPPKSKRVKRKIHPDDKPVIGNYGFEGGMDGGSTGTMGTLGGGEGEMGFGTAGAVSGGGPTE